MRIIGGEFRGRALSALGKGDAGAHLRPTTDRVRESLFNILQGGRFGDPIEGAKVLDLFAGTGALGLEALSRGADEVCFIENGRKSQSLIRSNIKLCRCESRARLVGRDARKLGTADAPFDLVFLDPPYGKDLGSPVLEAALKGGWIAPDALIVWEEGGSVTAPDGFTLLETREFGGTQISFLEVS